MRSTRGVRALSGAPPAGAGPVVSCALRVCRVAYGAPLLVLVKIPAKGSMAHSMNALKYATHGLSTQLLAQVKLLATTSHVRAWPGGTGNAKCGGNYAPGIQPQVAAAKDGFAQNLWLFGEDESVTEVGTMNQFFFWTTPEGERELITAPLDDGTILAGVTRSSILALAREWGEFKVSERTYTMGDVIAAQREGRLIEAFGSGTACIVCPVDGFRYRDEDYAIPVEEDDPTRRAGALTKRFLDELQGIQYGTIPHEWSVVVD